MKAGTEQCTETGIQREELERDSPSLSHKSAFKVIFPPICHADLPWTGSHQFHPCANYLNCYGLNWFIFKTNYSPI